VFLPALCPIVKLVTVLLATDRSPQGGICCELDSLTSFLFRIERPLETSMSLVLIANGKVDVVVEGAFHLRHTAGQRSI